MHIKYALTYHFIQVKYAELILHSPPCLLSNYTHLKITITIQI